MKQLIVIFFCLWFWFLTPAIINAEPIEAVIDSLIAEESVQPVKTYYLTVLGQGRRELKIDPPATKIVVTSQSGDTTIRCGDEQNVYTCSPGRRLELEYGVSAPVVKFWGENLSDIQVRLQIDVYQIVPE
ncbi:MAG: hypothetical protein QNJ55_22085 [Xenococcus sp. MO_188.B8]|nr:hypothetical protein [Xenococcus sp. MO_188.B8]